MAALTALVAAGLLVRSSIDQEYYVGADGNRVVIYQGLQGSVLGLRLSSEAEDSGLTLDELRPSERTAVRSGITTSGGLDGAHGVVDRLRQLSLTKCSITPGTPAPAPTPSAGPVPANPAAPSSPESTALECPGLTFG